MKRTTHNRQLVKWFKEINGDLFNDFLDMPDTLNYFRATDQDRVWAWFMVGHYDDLHIMINHTDPDPFATLAHEMIHLLQHQTRPDAGVEHNGFFKRTIKEARDFYDDEDIY